MAIQPRIESLGTFVLVGGRPCGRMWACLWTGIREQGSAPTKPQSPID
jgi:hypothetical protein